MAEKEDKKEITPDQFQDYLNRVQEIGLLMDDYASKGLEVPSDLWSSFTKTLAESNGMKEAVGSVISNEESKASYDQSSAILAKIAEANKVRLLEDVKTKQEDTAFMGGIETISNIIDLGISSKQIKESNKAVSQLKKPSSGKRLKLNKSLSEAISRAERAISPSSIEASLRPAQGQIADSYRKDIENARIASSGQAGSFGSMAQAAVNRRSKSALGLIPMREQLRQAREQRLDPLLEMQGRENTRDAMNDAQRANLDYRKYYDEAQAAGMAGSKGRLNLRNSLKNLLRGSGQGVLDSRGIGNLNNQINNSLPLNDPRKRTSVGMPVATRMDNLQVDASDPLSLSRFDDDVNSAFTSQDFFEQENKF